MVNSSNSTFTLRTCSVLVQPSNNTMISLEGFQRQLLLWLDPLSSHLLHFKREYLLRRLRAIDTVGLDRDNDTATSLKEQMCVQSDDTCLIRLRHIGKDTVDHTNKHAVFQWVTGILDNRDDIRPLRRQTDQVTTRAVGELDGVDDTSRTDNIGDVGDGGSRGGTEVEDFRAGLHVDCVHTTKDTRGQLRTERVPDTVFSFCGGWAVAVCTSSRVRGLGGVDGDALFTVGRFTLKRLC